MTLNSRAKGKRVNSLASNEKRRQAQLLGFDAYDVEDRGYLTACWIYRKKPTSSGYAQMKMPDGTQPAAHRAFYEHHVGPIPEGLTIDHLCKVSRCVNPTHLDPCTRGENTLRGDSPSSINARKTHCMRGHEFTAENTYVGTHGWRCCRTCHAAWHLNRRREGKAAA